MSRIITRTMLTDRQVCAVGLAWFDQTFPDGEADAILAAGACPHPEWIDWVALQYLPEYPLQLAGAATAWLVNDTPWNSERIVPFAHNVRSDNISYLPSALVMIPVPAPLDYTFKNFALNLNFKRPSATTIFIDRFIEDFGRLRQREKIDDGPGGVFAYDRGIKEGKQVMLTILRDLMRRIL